MKDIDDELKEKYDEVEVPEYMFDTSRVFKRVKEEKKDDKKKIISIAASIVAVLLIAVSLIFVIPKYVNKNTEMPSKAEENRIVDNIDIVKGHSTFDGKKIDFVGSIKVNKIIDYEIIDNIPYCKIEANVLECYYGEKINNIIEIYVPGGVFKIKDLLANNIYNNVEELNKYDENDFVNITYCNEIKIPFVKEGNIYITSVKEKNGSYFVDLDKAYGFKEYNPETNIVKDDMGDEILEMDKYLVNIDI